ncbi:MAG: hypothetical protein ACPL1Y_00340 [Thermoplasmata archaeon]
MNKIAMVWICLWLFAGIGIFFICVIPRSTDLAGIFALTGIIIAAVAQLVFGSASWGFMGRGRAAAPMPYVTRFPTFMKVMTEDRYTRYNPYEWNIGTGLTIFGILMFVSAILASAYLWHLKGL